MSELTEKPAAAAEKPAAAVAEKPAEKPFTTDVLQSCTARYTYRAWHTFQACQTEGLDSIQNTLVRASLKTTTPEALSEVENTLKEAGVTAISRVTTEANQYLELTTTWAVIQLVIKHPDVRELDAIRA